MKVIELIHALSIFDNNAVVLIESSDGEYGPRVLNTVLPHKGKDERYGVDYPAVEKFQGYPVLRA